MIQEGVLPQKVIVYLDADRNRVAYDTAYTSAQNIGGLARCRKRHGLVSAQATVVNADKLPPEKL